MKANSLLKIGAVVFDFDGTLAELHIDFNEMKRRLSLLAGTYSSAAPPEPFLPVLEWLLWLEEDLKAAERITDGRFRDEG
ncbi:MAG: hypothetical protein AAGU11_07140, partial [Syntrophobacteraceae bacterium]